MRRTLLRFRPGAVNGPTVPWRRADCLWRIPARIPILDAFLERTPAMRPLPLLAALLLTAAPLRAQVVRGTVVDSASGAPVNGVVVVLIDATAAPHGGAFTDPQGRFELRAPAAGQWRVRAERVGYRGMMTPLLDLAAGDDRALRIVLAPSAARLGEIRVTATRRCVVHPERGAETAELWTAVRAALRGAALTSRQARLGLRIAKFERELDDAGRERWVTRTERITYSETPFVSVPIEALERDGFVVKHGETIDYRVPDAEVLLSERFLESHCFRIEPPPPGSGDSLIGLAFEPVPERSRSDVQGVLWVNANTTELRRLEVSFTKLEHALAERHAGARVEFRRLPTGHWIVGRWVIRMPVLREHRSTELGGMHVRTDLLLHAIHETGGEVVEILGERRISRASARITGTVVDSTRGRPLAEARVFVSGTALASVTDSTGRFVLDGLRAGDHAIAFAHPRLDSLGTVAPAVGVGVAGGDTTTVQLAVPSWLTLLRMRCGSDLAARDGAIVGWVRSAANGLPIHEAVVTVQWSVARAGRGAQPSATGRVDVRTDREGAFTACGIPGSAAIRVAIGADGHAPSATSVEVRAGELTRIDRVLPREPGRLYEPPRQR